MTKSGYVISHLSAVLLLIVIFIVSIIYFCDGILISSLAQVFSKYHSYSRNAFSEIDGGNSEEQVPSILPTIQTKVEVEGIVSKAPVPTASVFNTSLYTNYAIQNISLPSFVSGVSWNDLSKRYKAKTSKLSVKSNVRNHLMPIKFGWSYLEDITLKLRLNEIKLHRPIPISGETHLVDCTITGIQTNETISQPMLLSSVNKGKKVFSIPQNNWYDQVAILSTRGFSNIYHNAEWIMNFVHFAACSTELPLFDAFIVINPTHDDRFSSTTPWNNQFFLSILSIFPSSRKPLYIPRRSLSRGTLIHIHRAMLISITTPLFDLFRSYTETIYVKKVVYKYVGVSETTTSPLKLVGLLILREGRTRQIINKNELLQMLEECLGDSVSFSTQFFGGISFKDQVKVMSRTDLVFGMHGAAFVNIMFMRPRSGFIEFFSPTSQIPYYQNMAKHCDLISEGISKVTADKSRKMPKDHRNLNIIVDLPYAKTVFSSVVAEVKKQKYALVKTNVL
ncbi:hypothetical protein WA171_001774 [Blastocystis sp. BT1]